MGEDRQLVERCTCSWCGKVHPVESMARHCEQKHEEQDI